MNQSPLIRPLIIAEAANPEWVSVPLAGWSIVDAIRKFTDAHVATQVRNRGAFLRAGLVEGQDFTAIDNERIARPMHRAAKILRMGKGKGWTMVTALSSLSYPSFERILWKTLRNDLLAGRFDLVHRVTPRTPTAPSPMAKWCRDAGIPFVVGPLNGGLPWPPGYEDIRAQEREYLSKVRSLYRLVPGQSAMLKNASLIMCGSKHTMSEIPRKFEGKTVYVAPNGIDSDRFSEAFKVRTFPQSRPLRACFIGRLVPYKGPDMLIDAAGQLLRDGSLEIDFIGDGPMQEALRQRVAGLGVQDRIRFHGNVPHARVQDIAGDCDVLAFPSIREFGGAVILEAMALGVVPIVVDYGGPGEFVDEDTGFKIPIGPRDAVIRELQAILTRIARDRSVLPAYSVRAQARIGERFTWEQIGRSIVGHYRELLSGASQDRASG